jgi:Ca2+-binding EF-hand superfamily protein
MQMILKSMGVKVDKDELENYAGEADEAGTGKFSFTTFCQERGETPGNGSKVRG